MNYSPKLKKAMQQIQNILIAEDIAGVVALHEPGFGEFLIKIDPSYSGAKIDHHPVKGKSIKIRIKEKELGKEKSFEMARDTTNMFHVLSNIMGPQALQLMETSEYMDKHYNADHFGKGSSSNTSQFN